MSMSGIVIVHWSHTSFIIHWRYGTNQRNIKYMLGSMDGNASEVRVPLSTVASQVVNPNVVAELTALNIAPISYNSHIDAYWLIFTWYDHDEVYGEVCIVDNACSVALPSKTLNPNVNVRYSHSILFPYIAHHSMKIWHWSMWHDIHDGSMN